MFAVCWLLFVGCCLLTVAGNVLSACCYCVFLVFVCLLFDVSFVLFVVCCLLVVVVC